MTSNKIKKKFTQAREGKIIRYLHCSEISNGISDTTHSIMQGTKLL